MVNAGRKWEKMMGGRRWSKQMTLKETNFHSQAFWDKLLDTNLLFNLYIFPYISLSHYPMRVYSLIHLTFQSKGSRFSSSNEFRFHSIGDMMKKFMEQDENRLIFDVLTVSQLREENNELKLLWSYLKSAT